MTRTNAESYRYNMGLEIPGADLLTNSLRTYGVAVVDNFLGKDTTDKIVKSLNPLLTQIKAESENLDSRKNVHERDKYIISFGGKNYSGYLDLAEEKGKGVVTLRRKRDTGMLDVFGADRIFPSLGHVFSQTHDKMIQKSASRASGVPFTPSNLNLYHNKSVTETRGFHVDRWGGHQLKAFIYLTDVLDKADGAHMYILGSHKKQGLKRLNKLWNRCRGEISTNCRIYNKNQIIPILGARGTLIISFQNGVHRGHPQSIGRERLVLVKNYIASSRGPTT